MYNNNAKAELMGINRLIYTENKALNKNLKGTVLLEIYVHDNKGYLGSESYFLNDEMKNKILDIVKERKVELEKKIEQVI